MTYPWEKSEPVPRGPIFPIGLGRRAWDGGERPSHRGLGRGWGSGGGKPRKFENGEQLMAKFDEYVEEVNDNPYREDKAYSTKDGIQHTLIERPRPLTLTGFYNFIGIHAETWRYWKRERSDLIEAVTLITNAIYDDKFSGAAAGLYNPMIISRDLGLSEKVDVRAEEPAPAPAPPDEYHLAIHQHPDDPDPLGIETGIFPRPMYSRAQLKAGVPFCLPPKPPVTIEGVLAADQPSDQQK